MKKQPILGFDCEWITEGKKRRPIALLQLATYKQFCVILRLTQLPDIPKTFKVIIYPYFFYPLLKIFKILKFCLSIVLLVWGCT